MCVFHRSNCGTSLVENVGGCENEKSLTMGSFLKCMNGKSCDKSSSNQLLARLGKDKP